MFRRLIVGIAIFLFAQTAQAGYLPCPDSYLSTADECPSGVGGWVKFPSDARFCSTDFNAGNYCYSGSPGSSKLTLIGTKSTDTACIQAISRCGVAAPGNLTARGKTSEITVSWDSSGGGTSYTLKRGTASGTYGTTVASGITARTYDDTTAVNGTRYYYVVAATNTYGTSANSTSVASAYALARPTLSSAVAGNAQVTLTWTAVTVSGSTANYTIKRATAPGGPYSSVATGITGTSYINTGLTNDTTYYYVVSATHAVGPSESDNSVERSATPRPPIPAAPTGLTATPGDARVSLSWTAPQYAASYTVKRGTATGGPYTTIATGVTATSYVDNSAVNGTTYYYVVSATNTAGTGPNSSQVSATPVAAPPAPTNFAVAVGATTLTFTWDASAGATSYTIWRSTTPGGTRTSVASGITGTTRSIVESNASNYYYTVTALNASGTSAVSNEVNPPLVSAPTNLTVAVGATTLTFTWTAPAGETVNSYTVWRSTTPGGTRTSMASGVTGTTRSIVASNASNYYYTVTALNASGESQKSNEVNPPLVSAPTNLTVATGATGLTFSWTAPAGEIVSSYTILRSKSPGGTYSTVVSGVTTVTRNTKESNSSSNYYTVVAINASGTSVKSNIVQRVSAPTGLTATAGDEQVVLGWGAVSGATSYNILRSTTSGGPYVSVASSTAASYTNTGLVNGTAYYYVVKASNAYGVSGNSAQVSATPLAVPGAPSNFTATPGNTQVVLAWTASGGAASYTIKRSTTAGGPYTAFTGSTGITGTSHTNTGLVNGTTYYYVVFAVNGSGTSASSAEVSATPIAPPVVPTGLVVTGLTSGGASLAWNAVSGAASYTLLRSQTSGSGYSAIPAATDITSTNFSDTGLTLNTLYYYVVRAKNASGTSANSAQVSAQPIATPTLTRAAGTGRVVLTWNAQAGATGYKIRRSLTPTGATTTISVGAVTTSTDTPLINGTTYYYVIAASNATGTGAESVQVSATPIAAPINFTATVGDQSITLGWTQSSGADSYDLRQSLTPTGASTTIGLGDQSSYTDNNLTNGTLYYYHLVAKNDLGTGRSNVSAQVSAIPNIIPATPANLTAIPGNAQITLSWSASVGATSYKLIRSMTPNGATTTIALGNVTSRVDPSLVNGTAYYYRVVAVNSAGQSAPSVQVSATPQVPSSIVLTLAPTPSRCSQKTTPSSTGVIEVRGSLAVSGGFPPYTVVWTPTPAWKSPAGSPLPFLAKFRYSSPVETFATTAPFPAITATITDAAGGTATVSRNLVPCANVRACVMP